MHSPLRFPKGSFGRIAMAAPALALLAGCSSIANHRGYIMEPILVAAVQPGLDNKESVMGTLGNPTLTSQFGDPIWYYVSSTTEQAPFSTARITSEDVLVVKFDANGLVTSSQITGMENVVHLDPDGDKTPTLGRERSFLEDLFGNIGTVGAPGMGGQQRAPGS